MHVKGPTSFKNLRTVKNKTSASFKEACVSLGLVENDNQNISTMQETILYATPNQSRCIFAYLLVFCEIANPLMLWIMFSRDLCEDFLHSGLSFLVAKVNALAHIKSVLIRHGSSLSIHGLPDVKSSSKINPGNISINDLKIKSRKLAKTLYKDQKTAAKNILRSLFSLKERNESNCNDGTIFFVDGPGGSGKTYLYNFLVCVCRSFDYKVSCSAYSGVAATLLENGSTCHSVFKLPVPCIDGSKCHVSPASEYGNILRGIDIFIIDEISMMNKFAFEAIDRMLKDVCKNKDPFGGKVMVFGGDFRQTLPIVKRGSADQIIDQCVVSSPLWSRCQHLTLNTNMRASENKEFANYILKMGSNTFEDPNCELSKECIEIPSECILEESTLPSLINYIFPKGITSNEMQHRVILTPTNKSSLEINDEILKVIPGDIIQSFSCDSALHDDAENANLYPIEFLNSLNSGGLPPHILKLKKGSIVMLLKNLDIQSGLSNGTRLVLRNVHSNVIEADILCGVHAGNRHFIPKVYFQPSDIELPFIFKRFQFPIRLAYSMTINKSQGQSFSKVGIFLERSCFGHGQLYVAFSRGRSFEGLKILMKPDQHQGLHLTKHHTRNIVYQRVLDLCHMSCLNAQITQQYLPIILRPLFHHLSTPIQPHDSHVEISANFSSLVESTPESIQSINSSIPKSPVVINLTSKFDQISRQSVFGDSLRENSIPPFPPSSGSVHFEIEECIYPSQFCGLINMGNTCYVASIVQTLRSHPELFDSYQENGLHSSLAKSFRNLMSSMNFRHQIAPIDFLETLGEVFLNQFQVNEQQDVPEILQRILNNFSECSFIQKNDIEIRYNQETKCSSCNNIRTFVDSTFILPITVSSTIQDSLDLFFRNVALTGENQYDCENCNGRQDAEQHTYASETPEFLFLQLRRFSVFQGRLAKDDTIVYPNEIISIKTKINGLERTISFELASAIHHIGGIDHGHYISYINVSGTWHKWDDTRHTSPIDLFQIDNSGGYLFMYKVRN